MKRQRILLVLPMIFLSAPASGLAASPNPISIQYCINEQQAEWNMLDFVCKTHKCTGPAPVRPGEQEIKRDCACADGVLQSKLSPRDYNRYLKISDDKSQPSKEEEAYYQKNILPKVDQAQKSCGLTQ